MTLAHLRVMQVASCASITVSLDEEVTIGQLAVASAQSATVCTPLSLPGDFVTLAAVLSAVQIRELWLAVCLNQYIECKTLLSGSFHQTSG